MLQTAIDQLLESEQSMAGKIEIINELEVQLLDTDYLSNLRVKLIQEGQSIADEFDICPEDGLSYEYQLGIKRCPRCGRRSDNE